MLQGFSFGIWTIIGAALGPVAAYLAFKLRRFIAFMDGKQDQPRPFFAWCIMFAIAGAVAGSLWQGSGVAFIECRGQGHATGECFFKPLTSRD
ncbi:hypothetical protein [Stenotrophomonas rhizophila]|uniref:hypothetical protein n=1 Tax=Stenotrophomonas rhizophila TaxID=216778 RepID=UPI001E40BCDA|nr:hypothetical protein [Stenotrophomonas rhizophila]MCC7632595.1 hypothetical protein [Stenotrophomonas rhizophila]MCC7663447.1 hypothetical protein [Stenotrophomonas rhizophila]